MNKYVNALQDDELVIGAQQHSEAHAAVAKYLQQLNTLMIMRHITMLMIEAQRHRGASMAVLAGEQEFFQRVEHSQLVISRYLSVIQQLNQQNSWVISDDKWKSINQDWQMLIAHWQEDTVVNNFEFHNHFIGSLVKLIWELANNCRLALGGGKSTAESDGVSQVILNITFKLMPELLENIARIRGLATHVSALGYCDPDFDGRFAALLQALNMNKEKMRATTRTLQHDALRSVPSLAEILLQDHKLDQLQQTVSTKIRSRSSININSEELFDFASDIIDTYSQVIHDGITFFRRRIERELGDAENGY